MEETNMLSEEQIKSLRNRKLIFSALFILVIIFTALLFMKIGAAKVCHAGDGVVINGACRDMNMLTVCPFEDQILIVPPDKVPLTVGENASVIN